MQIVESSECIAILTYFTNKQYRCCIEAIQRLEVQSVIEQLILSCNVVVCQLLQDFSNEEAVNELFALAEKVYTLPFLGDLSARLCLQLSSNLMYVLVSNPYKHQCRSQQLILDLLGMCFQQHDEPRFQHYSSIANALDTLELLYRQASGSTEKCLLRYMNRLVTLSSSKHETDENAFSMPLDSEDYAESLTALPMLLLGPPAIPLYITSKNLSRVEQFTQILDSVLEFHKDDLKESVEPRDETLRAVSCLLKALQCFKAKRNEDCLNELSKINFNTGSSETLLYAKSVVFAAALSAMGKNSLALQKLRIAIGSSWAKFRDPCCLALTGMAVQFSTLDCVKEELESWDLALQCLSQTEVSTPLFHDNYVGYLLSYLGLLQLDSYKIKYNYARRLLETEDYEKAAVIYNSSFQDFRHAGFSWNLFEMKERADESTRLRELLICYYMAKDYAKIIELCDDLYHVANDFFLFFVDGLARSRQRLWKESLKSLNRAISLLHKEVKLDNLHSALLCRLHLCRAQVLEQQDCIPDTFHAIRMALQASPQDQLVVQYYDKFRRDRGSAKFPKLDFVSELSVDTKTVAGSYALQWILSSHALPLV